MLHVSARKLKLTLNHYTLQVHSAYLRNCITLALLGILCYQRGEAFEGNDFGEDQIAMESESSYNSFPQYRSYLPPPSDFKPIINPSDDDIEELPSPAKWKSSSELRKSTSRTFKVCTYLSHRCINKLYMLK